MDTHLVTKNGYDVFELLSAIQKCIRRQMEYEAAFFAAELEEEYSTHLWNRLKIVASEDIGPANPFMPILIETLYTHYKYERKKSDEEASKLDSKRTYNHRLFFINAVICLCRVPQSRDVDDLTQIIYCQKEYEHKKLEIPDFAFDMHTRKGLNMGHKIDHFYKIGCILANPAFQNAYTDIAKKLREKFEEPNLK